MRARGRAMMSDVKRASYPVSLLVGTLALAGCSGIDMSEGAVIDGTGYSVQEVQEAAEQMSTIAPEPVDIPTLLYEAGVVSLLDEAFAGSPYEVTESELRSSLADQGLSEEASDLTMESARFRYYGSLVNSEAAAEEGMQEPLAALQQVTVEDIDALPIEVNPRFGTWDGANGGVVPQVPEWIQTSAG